jgi:hypothetical protein
MSNVSRLMPTIEICAVGQRNPVAFKTDAFALKTDAELMSHRCLFARDLAQLSGCIYHLGNKECEAGGFFFGSRLLSERSLDEEGRVLEFRADVKAAVVELMRVIYCAAATEYLLFLTDYQFGPADPVRAHFGSPRAFWNAHDSGQLRMNALYAIEKDD